MFSATPCKARRGLAIAAGDLRGKARNCKGAAAPPKRAARKRAFRDGNERSRRTGVSGVERKTDLIGDTKTAAGGMSWCEPVSPDGFRAALGMWPSGVTVITAFAGSKRVGLTVAAFCSLSLEPPLVLACIGVDADSHDGIVNANMVAVHVLSVDESELSSHFASKSRDKFANQALEEGIRGVPVLKAGVARLVCVPHRAIGVGDHTILVGEVVGLSLTPGQPLAYCAGAYSRLSRL